MSGARVLHLTARSMTVQRWRDSRLEEAFAFDVDARGIEQFSCYIAAAPHERTLLLVDRVEEEFTVETLPHAVGRARAQLHARRAERLFRTTPFRATVALGRESDGRRDDRLLFSALTQSEVLLPWLQPLLECAVPLQAVSSVAHVSGELPRALGLNETELLLVTREEEGLRQTLFKGGQLRLSRLSSHPDLAPPAIIEEIARTRRYLLSNGLLETGVELPVCLLAAEPLIAQLERLPLPEGIPLRFGAIEEVASAVGLGRCGSLGAAGVLGGLFQRSPQDRYAGALHRDGWRARQLRSLVEWSGVAIALLFCLAGIVAALAGLEAQRTTLALKAQLTRELTQAGTTPDETLPDSLTPEQLASSVENAERMARLPMRPDAALVRLGAALRAQPELSLQRVRWAASRDAGFGDLPPEGEAYSAVTSSGAANTAADCIYQSLIVHARVEARRGALRASSESAGRVLTRFKSMPEVVEATLLSGPIDPVGPVKASVGREDQSASGFPVTLRVVLRP